MSAAVAIDAAGLAGAIPRIAAVLAFTLRIAACSDALADAFPEARTHDGGAVDVDAPTTSRAIPTLVLGTVLKSRSFFGRDRPDFSHNCLAVDAEGLVPFAGADEVHLPRQVFRTRRCTAGRYVDGR